MHQLAQGNSRPGSNRCPGCQLTNEATAVSDAQAAQGTADQAVIDAQDILTNAATAVSDALAALDNADQAVIDAQDTANNAATAVS